MNRCEIYDPSRFRQEGGIVKTLNRRSHIPLCLRRRKSTGAFAHMGARHSSESQSHHHQHPTPGIVVEWPICPKRSKQFNVSWDHMTLCNRKTSSWCRLCEPLSLATHPVPSVPSVPSPEAQASASRFTQRGNAGVLWHLSTSLGHIRIWSRYMESMPHPEWIYIYIYVNM